MGKLLPVAFWMVCNLCSIQVYANDISTFITTQNSETPKELPALDGSSALSLDAPAPGALTLNEAVDRAVAWHPTIREAIGKLSAQTEQVNAAKSKYYPQVSAGMNNGYTNSYSDSGFSPSLVLYLSQMLYDFGKVSSQVRAEKAGESQAQANVLLNIDDVSFGSANAMVQVQLWQQMVNIAKEQLDALNAIGRLTQKRNDEGASSMSDVVQTDARIESARSQLLQYQSNLESTQATLMNWLGWNSLNSISNDFPDSLNKSCEVNPSDDPLIPSVLIAWAQANVAQANLDYANVQMKPTISLEPSVQHYLNDKYAGHDYLDRTQYSAFIKVEMPIYQGGGMTARHNAANHAVEASQFAVQHARLDARQKLMESRSQALSLTGVLQVLQRQEQLSTQTRELYQQQYLDLGSRPLLDVLNAEQEVFQARFSRQQTLSQLHQLQLNCLYNTGKLRHAFGLEHRSIQSLEIQP